MSESSDEIRPIQRPFWIVVGISVIAWASLGTLLPREKTPINDLFDIAALSAFFAALAFVIVYTAAGFIGHEPRPRWWKNELGTYLVLVMISRLFVIGPTAFAIMFNEGKIDTWWWAWTWIGGHVLAAVMVFALVWIWIRNTRLHLAASRKAENHA